MPYHIEASKNIEKFLKTIPKADLLRIKDRIHELAKDPRPPGNEKIDDNLYRVRQGNYRILYQIFDKKLLIIIISIDHRKQVYRDL